MRRTDRLFELIQILRDGRLHTARDMADRLEVSTRTLWRSAASNSPRSSHCTRSACTSRRCAVRSATTCRSIASNCWHNACSAWQ